MGDQYSRILKRIGIGAVCMLLPMYSALGQAQREAKVSLGMMGFLHYTNTIDRNSTMDLKYIKSSVRADFGVSVRIRLKKAYGFETGVWHTRNTLKSNTFQLFNGPNNIICECRRLENHDFIEVPLLLTWDHPLSQRFKLRFTGGLVLGRLYHINKRIVGEPNKDFEPIEAIDQYTAKLKTINYKINTAGLWVSTGIGGRISEHWHAYLQPAFRITLTNIYQDLTYSDRRFYNYGVALQMWRLIMRKPATAPPPQLPTRQFPDM